ncbi:MAG TPA: Stp1/IreP family PP2C-type Ser/Thr phosphatase [Solirubrobacteraceae bacterium]|nr:Stp1/IreP family PP2C-type Ser/Thr phosphatase [Solirubrobacteraceae bacterium]
MAEQYAGSDTGRQRRANEDSLLARSPLFVIADGMGGAQAGEVASKLAVDAFQSGLPDSSEPELALAALAHAANARIHELSHASAEHAGMGTTLTAVYVTAEEVAIAHVGDSRAYCLRDAELLRLTDDHSLVDELMRQGRLTPEEAVEHPQRSVITRALGPEGMVEVDTRSFRARPGDVYLLCSDGLTTMITEEEVAAVLLAHPRLHDAGEALIAAANDAGGRDNITVVLFRLEDVHAEQLLGAQDQATMTDLPAVVAPPQQGVPPRTRTPRAATAQQPPSGRARKSMRRLGASVAILAVLALIGCGAYLALQSVYFIGTNDRGLVTLYQGVPYRLPGNIALYSSRYVSGVSASTLSSQRRRTLLDHSLRSEANAASLIRSLELGQLE